MILVNQTLFLVDKINLGFNPINVHYKVSQ